MSADELRLLQERAAMVEEMTASHGWPLLLDRARVTIVAKQTRIVQGKCADHEDYVRETAFLDGVEWMISLPQRIQMELELHLGSLAEDEDEEEVAYNEE